MADGHATLSGPLRIPEFRLLWLGGLALNLALWMQSVGAAWLMLSLAPSPLMVALIQTAQSLPTFLLGLPAGVLADLVNRRHLILFSCSLLLLAAGLAAGSTATSTMTPLLLLVITAMIGAGFSLQAPAVHTSLVEAVPREQLFTALALSAISFNAARAVGPAIAGAIVATAGTVAVFVACAALIAVSFGSALRWRPQARLQDLPPERVLLGVQGALQYARHSPVIRAQLARTILFVGAASGVWALLPVLARDRLHLDADGYGLLLGSLGAGAIVGAFTSERLRRRWSMNRVGMVSAAAYALGTLVTAESSSTALTCIALGFAGAGWAVVGNVNLTAIQTAIPPWVRARAMALYLLVFQGAMALGSLLWGTVATHAGLEGALLGSVVVLALTVAVMRVVPARIGDAAAATPSEVLAPPDVQVKPGDEDGPIAVQVNYVIREHDRTAFLEAMTALGRSRRRDGALFWRIYRDLGDPHRYAERFVVRSWTDYLRQQARATAADRAIEQRAWQLHVGDDAPEMQHMLAEKIPDAD